MLQIFKEPTKFIIDKVRVEKTLEILPEEYEFFTKRPKLIELLEKVTGVKTIFDNEQLIVQYFRTTGKLIKDIIMYHNKDVNQPWEDYILINGPPCKIGFREYPNPRSKKQYYEIVPMEEDQVPANLNVLYNHQDEDYETNGDVDPSYGFGEEDEKYYEYGGDPQYASESEIDNEEIEQEQESVNENVNDENEQQDENDVHNGQDQKDEDEHIENNPVGNVRNIRFLTLKLFDAIMENFATAVKSVPRPEDLTLVGLCSAHQKNHVRVYLGKQVFTDPKSLLLPEITPVPNDEASIIPLSQFLDYQIGEDISAKFLNYLSDVKIEEITKKINDDYDFERHRHDNAGFTIRVQILDIDANARFYVNYKINEDGISQFKNYHSEAITPFSMTFANLSEDTDLKVILRSSMVTTDLDDFNAETWEYIKGIDYSTDTKDIVLPYDKKFYIENIQYIKKTVYKNDKLNIVFRKVQEMSQDAPVNTEIYITDNRKYTDMQLVTIPDELLKSLLQPTIEFLKSPKFDTEEETPATEDNDIVIIPQEDSDSDDDMPAEQQIFDNVFL